MRLESDEESPKQKQNEREADKEIKNVLIANIKNMTTGQRKEIMKRDEVCSNA